MNKKALYDISYGLFAVTVNDNGRSTGCIVNTVFQITSEGPIIALSLNHNNYTHKIVSENKKFAINILSQDTPKEIITKLGYFCGKDTDKMQDIDFSLIDGLAILDKTACSYMICEVTGMHETATHDVFFAKVLECEKLSSDMPMTYEYYRTVCKGTSPKNAPSYQKEEQTDKVSYVCDICNYRIDKDISNEGDDFKCPICSADKSHFKKI